VTASLREQSDRHALSDRVIRHSFTARFDRADDCVARNSWIDQTGNAPLDRCRVEAANATSLDSDTDLAPGRLRDLKPRKFESTVSDRADS
jgi:hypothetical protein